MQHGEKVVITQGKRLASFQMTGTPRRYRKHPTAVPKLTVELTGLANMAWEAAVVQIFTSDSGN